MTTLNYFLLFCFINLYNSFTLINIKYYPNFLSQYSKHKLNMGCDYYIDKDLDIYNHNGIIISYINLQHERGYYSFISALDEDEDGYDTEFLQYKEDILKPSMEPIIIYSNNSFNKLSFETKYKKIIENELNLFNKTLNDVSKIIKTENRYKR